MLCTSGLWRHPGFVRLWAGQTVSVFGTLIGGLALQYTAIRWLDAGPGALGLLAASQLAPGFAVGLLAGAWADRLRRRPVLIAADLGRAAALASVPLAAVLDVLTLPQLYTVAMVTSALTVFFDSAYQAYLPGLVGAAHVVEGNSKLAASASTAEFASFSIGGFLVQALTAPGAVLVDAASFAWSAVLLATIRAGEPPPAPRATRTHLLREVADGLSLVARHSVLRSLAVANVLIGFARRIVGVVILLYLNGELGFSPGVLGLIFGVGGVTALLGALGAARWRGHLGRGLTVSVLISSGGMLFIALPADHSLFAAGLLVASQLITDPASAFYEVHELSARQAVTPGAMQGRMNATVRFVEFGAALAGTAAGALIGSAFGLREALFTAAAAAALAAAWLALSPLMRVAAHSDLGAARN